MHYGHPDVFDRVFHITRGGISKASRVINISEDIYAGKREICFPSPLCRLNFTVRHIDGLLLVVYVFLSIYVIVVFLLFIFY